MRARGGELFVFADADLAHQFERRRARHPPAEHYGVLSCIGAPAVARLSHRHGAVKIYVDKPRNLAKSVTVE